MCANSRKDENNIMKIIKKSNCKINLNLKIVGIKDGFHLLESVFCPISIYDKMEISLSDKDEVCGMNIPQESNIIYKTIKKFKEKYNIKEFVRVEIKKEIPMQAGLGGGSSNAAFTIIAMNELFKLNLKTQEMIDFGKKIGSDVPFFIINKPSFVEGRGEFITPICEFKKIYGVLVFDDVYMSTKDVFVRYDDLSEDCTKKFEGEENDLEVAAISLDSEGKIKKCKDLLLECGCYKVLMSGAGGSVFGLCEEENLEIIFYKIKERYNKVWMFESV